MQDGSFFKPLIYLKTYYFVSDPKCARQNNAIIAPLHTIKDEAVRGDGGQDRKKSLQTLGKMLKRNVEGLKNEGKMLMARQAGGWGCRE